MLFPVEKVLEQIEKQKIEALYFLQGEELFYIDMIVDKLSTLLPTNQRDFNMNILYGKETDMKSIMELAFQYPLFASHRVVIVKEAQQMLDWKRKETQEKFIQYLKNPVKSTVLVFVYKYKKMDSHTILGKLLRQKAVFVDTKKTYESDIPYWIKNHCKKKKITIDNQAIAFLKEFIGNDLSQLSRQLEKLIISLDDKKHIGYQDIETHIGITKKYSVFDLQDTIIEKNISKSYQIIYYLCENTKEIPIHLVINILFYFFSKVLLFHQYKTFSSQELSKILGINMYLLPKYKRAMENYPLTKTITCLEAIHKADITSKGINEAKRTELSILKELIIAIIN